MQSLESFAGSILLSREKIESSVASAFVSYTSVKQKSSHIGLASSGGTIKKVKKRSPERTLYEFLSLRVWHDLLQHYSLLSPLKLCAPLPLGVSHLETEESALYMEFMPGYEVRKLGGQNLRRSFPVYIPEQETPVPLYPACALYLGALDSIKELEGLCHGDYDARHVIFKPFDPVSLAVIDVEGSRKDSFIEIDAESHCMFTDFERITPSHRDLSALRSWYEQGREMLSLKDKQPFFPEISEKINREYDIEFNMESMSLNGISLRERGST